MDHHKPADVAEPGERLLRGTRILLGAFSALTALAFVSLFVGAAQTDRYFAWTIEPSATAAFLGAAYASGCVLVIASLRVDSWPRIRIPYVTVLVFVIVTLVASVLHLDRFHLGAAGVLARFAAWFWLAIYVLVPVGMLVMLIGEERRPHHATRHLPVPEWVRVVLVLQILVLVAVSLTLFVAPQTSTWLWPWPLTPLTARVVAAWLLAFGAGSILALASRDLRRLELAAVAYVVLVALQVVVLVRFADTVRWGSPSAWGYGTMLASILFTAGFTLLRTSRRGGLAPQARRAGEAAPRSHRT